MSLIHDLSNNFKNLNFIEKNDKIFVEDDTSVSDVLSYLKNQSGFDILLSLYATDYIEHIELNYYLYSTQKERYQIISICVKNKSASIVDIFPSAYFDECEIYDLFGVTFIGNDKLKRLLMPEDWNGFPLKKDYGNKSEAVK